MKKVLIIIICLLFLITGCNNDAGNHPKINITLDTNGGILDNYILSVETGKINLPIPQKDRYTFLYWTLEDGTIIDDEYIFENDVTILANWVINGKKSYIYYDLQGGSFDGEYPTVHYSGEQTNLVSPQKEYHEFLGWYTNQEFIGEPITYISESVVKSMTLFAKWKDVAPYEDIIYNLDGGKLSENAPLRYIPGLEYQLIEPVKEGYYFMGYYDNQNFDGKKIEKISTDSSGTVELYVKWVEASLADSRISFIGDSITTFIEEIPEEYATFYPRYDVVSKEDTWWYKVIDKLGATLCMNNSYSGSKVSGGAASSASNPDRIQNIVHPELGKPDILVILIGINDWGYGVDSETFKTAYQSMLTSCKSLCPNTKIYICTITYNIDDPAHLQRLDEYNNIIKELASINDCKLIDIAAVITQENNDVYLADEVHPSKLGMELISDTVVEALKSDCE